jgi:phosphoribosylformimino-5-aminoimidazole carboxamide ribotide isomerase
MIAIPAIDLRDGCCVQLVGGSFEHERVRINDPVRVALRWADAGFRHLHVVDLDAATGRGSNRPVVTGLASATDAALQCGGGLRSTLDIEALLSCGVSRVVLGTRALRDRDWLCEVANAWPGRVVVAADAKRGATLTDGWTASLGRSVVDVVAELRDVPLASILVTAVDREGLMRGPDLPLMRHVVQSSAHPVIASGGIGTMNDLAELAQTGVYAAVIGMALYTGALEARAVAREFAA